MDGVEMKDLYQTLGLPKTASLADIKKAYRNSALKAHPDKGGNSERMAFLNEAYDILSDPEKRRDFNNRWQAFQESNPESSNEPTHFDRLDAGPNLSYSHAFRKEHQSFELAYSAAPLHLGSPQNLYETLKSDLYQTQGQEGPARLFHDIFSYINEMNDRSSAQTITFSAPKENFNSKIAIRLFTEFLSGHYYGNNLIAVSNYCRKEIYQLRSANAYAPELPLLDGIFEILSMAKNIASDKKSLLLSIKKITDYATQCDEGALSDLIPLFYNQYFKNLFSQALHVYWEAKDNVLDKDNIQKFDGRTETKELLDLLRMRLSQTESSDNLIDLVRLVKLLSNYEKDFGELSETADDYRDKAFHLLNWIPPLIESANKQIIVNIFMQIGINFQQASRLGTLPSLKMADEQLALKMYLIAVGLAHHSAPNIEMYANTHVLKYISQFHYQEPTLNEVIPALQKRTLKIADIFPFYESPQTNVTFLKQGNKSLSLMRRLLNSLIEIIEYNKHHSEPIAINQSVATVLYQAYEGCLKHWFQEEYNPDVEQSFRLDLMKELLAEQNWGFSDVDKNLSAPWVMVERDEDGWLKTNQSLPYSQNSVFETFRSIKGAEINHKTGEIAFFLDRWDVNYPDSEKSFTLFDLQEMLEKNISGAIFSLDPVDPDRPYHPFNVMRFGPSQLHESEFLNTMLLTDYILKFLTTKQEVQGEYPYAQQPIEKMIQHMPGHLKKIINDFHSEKHSEAMHRFWIEAEEIETFISTEEEEDVTRIGLGEIRMVVKKHRLERDIHGELKDTANESEGWPIYVLTPMQMRALEIEIRKIEGHAIICIQNENKIIFWENNKAALTHRPENAGEMLAQLYAQPQNEQGRILPNSENMYLLYNVTRGICNQAKLPHRYTPEFVFSIEFTMHYDEFARYMPEFGRLKQLSKTPSLIRVFNNIREDNHEKLQAVVRLLNTSFSAPTPASTESYKQYHQSYLRISHSINEQFQGLPAKCSRQVLFSQRYKFLDEIYRKITRPVSSKIDTDYSKQYFNPLTYLSVSRLWKTGRFTLTRGEIAEQNLEGYKKELSRVFSPILRNATRDEEASIISLFLRGEIEQVANKFVDYEQRPIIEQLKKQYSSSVTSKMIESALNGVPNAVQVIIHTEASAQFGQMKDSKEKMESGFASIGLGKHEEPVDLKDTCLWVPASVRHEVKEEESGASRSMFFVYGGVNIQPKIKITPNVRIDQNGRRSNARPAEGRPARYTTPQFNQGSANSIPPGNRKDILRGERKSAHEQVPRTADRRTKGVAGEAAGAKTLERAGYNILPSKLPGNQGFDHVGIKRNADGSIKKILIVESKYSGTGDFRLNKTATKGQQMSKRWIEKTISTMQMSEDPAIQATARILHDNKDKWVLRGNVLKPNGTNAWGKPTRVVNSQHQTDNQARAPPTP
jgi:curved DNA-binding protein CbpA